MWLKCLPLLLVCYNVTHLRTHRDRRALVRTSLSYVLHLCSRSRVTTLSQRLSVQVLKSVD